MKKHMKKVLSLLLCTLMIVTAALPAFAVDAEPKTTTNAGPLAITEMLIKSSANAEDTSNTYEGYSYIEILNTSDEAIDLSNYYLYMIGFSNDSGMYYASSAEQLLGLSNSQEVIAVKLNGSVAAHDVVVVMMNDKYTETQFITYWNEKGANLTDADVIDLDLSQANAKSIHNSTYSSSYKNFLPRNTYATFSLALIPANEAKDVNGNAVTGATYVYDGDYKEENKRPIRSILNCADCIVLYSPIYEVSQHVNFTPGNSANFTAFIEEESYNKSVDATIYPDVVTKKNVYYYDDLYPSIAVSDPSAPCEALMDLNAKHAYAEGGSKAVAMPKVRTNSEPTPGKLDGIQFGHSTDAGPLAMTEIAPNPASGANYEYIEVLNTSKLEEVKLNTYSIYRTGFSSGYQNWLYAGLCQMTGLDGASTVGNVGVISVALPNNAPTLKTGEVAVIWLKSDTNKTLDDFKNYYITNHGATFDSNTKIVELDVSAYPATAIHGSAGIGFLSDNKYANYALAFGNTADVTAAIGSATKNSAAHTKAIFNTADCMVVINKYNVLSNLASARFTSYIDSAHFNAAVDAAVYVEGKAPLYTYKYSKMYKSLQVCDPNLACEVMANVTNPETATSTNPVGNPSNMKAGGVPMPDVDFVHRHTPGVLDGEQFGFGGEDVTAGALAITEVLATTDNETSYEYVEIYNTTNANINLANYTLFLYGFSNGNGNNIGLGVINLYSGSKGTDAAANAYAQLSGTIEANKAAVIWFDNAETSIDDFKNYWTGKGCDMNNVNVIRVSYTTGISAKGNFLCGYKEGYVLALLNTTKATNDAFLASAITASSQITTKVSAAHKTEVIMNADSVALHMTHGKSVPNLSVNYYSFANVVQANAMLIDARAESDIYAYTHLRVYGNLMIKKDPVVNPNEHVQRWDAGYYDATGGTDYASGWYNPAHIKQSEDANVAFFENTFDSVPTPGRLVDGQFGYNAENASIDIVATQATDVDANGNVTLRIIGYIDSLEYENITVELLAVKEAVNDRTSKATSVDVAADAIFKTKQTVTTTTVYQNLTDNAENTYSATTFGKTEGHLFAIVITNVPSDLVNFTVRATVGDNVTGIYEISNFT